MSNIWALLICSCNFQIGFEWKIVYIITYNQTHKLEQNDLEDYSMGIIELAGAE